MSTIYRTHKNPRRRYLRRFLIITSIVVVLGGGIYGAVRLKLFTIQSVTVTGNQHLASTEIVPYAPPFSYFKSISITNIAVASSTIERNIFKKSLVVTVRERERYGIWCMDAGRCFWFDRTGFLFDTAAATRGTLVRNIHDMSGARLGIGDIAIEARFVPNLIGIVEALEQAAIPVVGMKLERRETQEIIAETASGPSLLFSLRIDPQFTREALRKLKDDLPRLVYADFRSENRVFFEYKK
ncbi:MAG: hypothetical protein HYS43_01830 [Candidatus Liptonbacteria bacterium]|nr:hypothetical protein [Candidatus Liptonbacteria bacterium]